MGKKKDSILTKKMGLIGMNFFSEIIPGNTPTQNGVYMVYYDYDPPQAWSKVKEVAGMAVVTYSNGKWGHNHKVYAYIGPLPQLALPALKECLPPYLIAQTFYIATLEQAAKGNFKSGPYSQYTLAFLSPGAPGEFIFCMDSENHHACPVSKFSTKKHEDGKFLTLKLKAIKKYNKMLDHLRSKND